MLKTATAASVLIALLLAPLASADELNASTGELSGFGGETLPSQPTNTQLPQSGIDGAEPLSAPGATAKTSTQGRGSFNIPNLPPVTTGMPFKGGFSAPGSLALQKEGLTELQDARYGILSNKEAALSGVLPDARYAVISDGPAGKVVSRATLAPSVLSKVLAPAAVLNVLRASEGF
ncbi:MAG: hypothetical protein K2X27_27060 [Candidatus Obscuribacterales bacterium]|nr:hypothetical protein [Candidatus Obscuribacterales bacterium]